MFHFLESHLKETGHSFEDCNLTILARHDRWFERRGKEAIYVKLDQLDHLSTLKPSSDATTMINILIRFRNTIHMTTITPIGGSIAS